MKQTTVKVRLLVTDKEASVIGGVDGGYEDRERIADRAKDALVYEGAQVVEVRDVEIPVTLLETPAPVPTEPKGEIVVPVDVRQYVEQELKRIGRQVRDETWDLFMDVVPPGFFQFYRDPGVRGMRRIEEKDLPPELLKKRW